jgi:hypothetical protein
MRIAAELDAASAKVGPGVARTVQHHGRMLATRVKANASGRPGPNVVTGDYRRSITLRMSGAGGFRMADVGTNKPQGRRLEYGFHGTDSLGRSYNQPPLPHFGPAFDQTVPLFMADLDRVVAGFFSRTVDVRGSE